MIAIDRFVLLVRALRRSEHGMALPTALFAMIAAFGLASATVMVSVDTQRGTSRDSSSKQAIATADAGANIALLRLNRYASALTVATPCLGVSSGTLVLTGKSADGWCPAVTGTVGGSTYSYRVTPAGSTMSVVSTGTASSVSRKIDVTFTPSSIGSIFEKEGLIGIEDMNISGSAEIHVGLGTNGNVNTTGNAELCGNVRHGIGKDWSNTGSASQCKGYGELEANITLPPVSTFMPADIATNNSDYRLALCTKKTATERTPAGCEEDNFTGATRTSTVPWNPTTRTISMTDSKSSLTLTGGDYWICKLDLNGGQLIMGEKAPVRIFFDTPENCGISSGGSQININGGSTVSATGYNEDLQIYEMPGFYLTGSTSRTTTVNINGNTKDKDEMVMYGPNTTFNINGNMTYIGVIAGKKVNINGNATITQPKGYKPPEIGGATIYSRQSYIECTIAVSSPPNAGC
ncbi:MAG TPA: hypothetical protein VFP21_00240 [Solirubrobacterales bacterium]|nr:hypothetical protein [Solirubrobacterales bacterium]